MRLTTGIVGHADLSVALLHHIAEFFKAEVCSIQGFTINQVRLMAIVHNRFDGFN